MTQANLQLQAGDEMWLRAMNDGLSDYNPIGIYLSAEQEAAAKLAALNTAKEEEEGKKKKGPSSIQAASPKKCRKIE